ncbi:MAG: 2'-5' RNA ligase family protein [Planctomycetota bacterium]
MEYSVVHFPPEDVRAVARHYQEPYAASLEVNIEPHFTIHPVFESDRSIEAFAAILKDVCSRLKPFKARLTGFDSFYGQKFVLFMRLADETRMAELQEKIDTAITEKDWKDVLGPGTKPRPHLTIGFFEKREELEQAKANLADEKIDLVWMVDAVDLIAEVKPAVRESVGTFRLEG